MVTLFEVRDPIHGFITFNSWEKNVIDSPAFQRLRRIHQLSLTSYIYPGAVHTRFEHSLGVMFLATRMFNKLMADGDNRDMLLNELGVNEHGLARLLQILRFAALLHDVGHAPFSHAAESIMPFRPTEGAKERYDHESYSIGIIQHVLKDLIEDDAANVNYGIKASEITNVLRINAQAASKTELFLHSLISSQLDADRADYLLRDSYYAGVQYGKYDLDRLIETLCVVKDENGSLQLALDESGVYAAESLILARYMMFSQVYFHKTRRVYDFHVAQVLKAYLKKKKKETFDPPINARNLNNYISIDDYTIYEFAKANLAIDDCKALVDRVHHRQVYYKVLDTLDDEKDAQEVENRLREKIAYKDRAKQSYYKGNNEVLIKKKDGTFAKLTDCSSVVIKVENQLLPKECDFSALYVKKDDVVDCLKVINKEVVQ